MLDVVQGDYFDLRVIATETYAINISRKLSWFAIEVVEVDSNVTHAVNTKMLGDVSGVPPEDGQVLIFNAALGRYVPGTIAVTTQSAAGVNKPFRGAMAILAADKTYTPSAGIEVAWDGIEYDTDGLWSAGQPSRLTIPNGVSKVRLHALLDPSNAFYSTENSYYLRIFKNGGMFRGTGVLVGRSGYNDAGLSVSSAVVPVVAGDYFTVQFLTSQTGSMILQSNVCEFSIEIVEATEVV